ncbi:unnamed protein product [Spirodela intermedia]|uniref:Reverse transcriptase domain-containing protein n=1 Tax=Spirodela intermedia TaxID=51605 RepID=A0A7I8L5Q3_SPIIN|nr:unnamed protein product [Spirodela intermedia]
MTKSRQLSYPKQGIILNRYPISIVDELIDELQGTNIFSKLDLKFKYYQIWMKASNIQKIAFKTHDGHYEFIVMSFDLSNAPATFQLLMNELF